MFGLSFGGGKKLIGLDIGASAVKLLAGDLSGGKITVSSLVVEPLPYRAIDERGIQDAPSVQRSIQAAFEKLGRKSPTCAISLHGSGVLTKRIVLPKVPKSEIPEQVRWEAEQVFPQDMASILVEYLLLGEADNVPNSPPGTKGWDLLLVGVHQNDVLSMSNLVDHVDVTLKLIDLDAFACGDLLDASLSLDKGKFHALVDIGAVATRVSVRHQGNALFVREFPIGGHTFTETIAQNLGLTFQDAETLKIQGMEGTFPEEARSALDGILAQWKAELQQCEDIFISQESNALLSSWHFYGGGSLTPGLMETLQDERFGAKARFVPADKIFKAAGKGVDRQLMATWAPRLLTAAGLSGRKA